MLIAVIEFNLCLFGKPSYIGDGDTLEDCHTLENGLDRSCVVQLLEKTPYRGNQLHQTLHHLFRHFQYNRRCLRTSGSVALLACEHPMFTHILASSQDGNGQFTVI